MSWKETHRVTNFYTQEGVEISQRAEQAARERYGADDEPTGVVLAQALADWLGEDGPLDGEV